MQKIHFSFDRLMTRREAAAYLSVKPTTLASWATTNRFALPYVRVGRLAKYRQRDLDKWMEKPTGTSAAEFALQGM